MRSSRLPMLHILPCLSEVHKDHKHQWLSLRQDQLIDDNTACTAQLAFN